MASVLSELISVMQQETAEYKRLYQIAVDKREVIVARELEPLERLTTEEQNTASTLKNLEKRRLALLDQIAGTLKMTGGTPNVSQVMEALPDEDQREALADARKQLVDIASQMRFMNEQNEVLLRQALEMVEFDLTLFKSLRQAPETANYGKNAYSTGEILPNGGFDAKQ